jgi:hypothetical protein
MTRGRRISLVSALTAVLGVFVAMGWITPEQSEILSQNIDTLIGSVMTIGSIIGVVFGQKLDKKEKTKQQ